jgi:predicted DNA-binding transcriptional regulator AlpA
VTDREIRAVMWETADGWHALLEDADRRAFGASTREDCVAELRRAAGDGAALTIEVYPALVGVAEAAALLGWDKRRIFTYLGRGSFPAPVAALASGRVWRRSDIEAFGRTRTTRRTRTRPTPEPNLEEPAR